MTTKLFCAQVVLLGHDNGSTQTQLCDVDVVTSPETEGVSSRGGGLYPVPTASKSNF